VFTCALAEGYYSKREMRSDYQSAHSNSPILTCSLWKSWHSIHCDSNVIFIQTDQKLRMIIFKELRSNENNLIFKIRYNIMRQHSNQVRNVEDSAEDGYS